MVIIQLPCAEIVNTGIESRQPEKGRESFDSRPYFSLNGNGMRYGIFCRRSVGRGGSFGITACIVLFRNTLGEVVQFPF